MHRRVRALFSGQVQGVGFRFTAERLARQFQVTGFVRNLPDGKVELVAEGEDAVAKEFLKAVCESGMAVYIRDVETNWSDAEGTFKHFGIDC